MKRTLGIFLAGLAAFHGLASTVTVGEMEFKTYPFSDPDPVPATSTTRLASSAPGPKTSAKANHTPMQSDRDRSTT